MKTLDVIAPITLLTLLLFATVGTVAYDRCKPGDPNIVLGSVVLLAGCK